jgi:hypothetical protein
MRAVLRLPDFRLLFAGLSASMVGDALMVLVYAIWVKSLTGSSGAAGLVTLFIALPYGRDADQRTTDGLDRGRRPAGVGGGLPAAAHGRGDRHARRRGVPVGRPGADPAGTRPRTRDRLKG